MVSDEEQKPAVEPVKTKTKRDGLYVHPRGTLSKQVKVSCASCISGHRSGECNHFDRILLQIRAAGRPSNTCHHNSSCGGSCLKQKAFVVPGEEPRWCRDHRSCIENWEFSDHCPPYPVSSKRKGRSTSPRRSSQTSSTPSTSHKSTSDSIPSTRATTTSSCCSSSANRRSGPSHPGPLLPVGQPIMVTANGHMPPSNWTPKSDHGPGLFSPAFEQPAPLLLPPLASGLEPTSPNHTPLTAYPRTSGVPYFDPYGLSFSNITTTSTSAYGGHSSSYVDDSASYHDDLASPRRHEHSSSFSLASNTIPASIFTFPPTATLNETPTIQPQTQRTNRQNDGKEPQQCPGNGFQCPCDENCTCSECYTHMRGWWTLPVGLDDAQQALSSHHEAPPPPTRLSGSITAPPPTRHNNHDEDDYDGNVQQQAGVLDPADLFSLEPSFPRF